MKINPTSSGIIAPKLTHHFEVKFLDRGNEYIASGASQQVTGVKLPLINRVSKVDETAEMITYKITDPRSQAIELFLEDDTLNQATFALYSLENTEYSVIINVLNGDAKILERYWLKNCSIKYIASSALDYAGGPQEVRGALSFPSYFTSPLPEQVEEFRSFLSGMTLTWTPLNQGITPVLKKAVLIEFREALHEIMVLSPMQPEIQTTLAASAAWPFPALSTLMP